MVHGMMQYTLMVRWHGSLVGQRKTGCLRQGDCCVGEESWHDLNPESFWKTGEWLDQLTVHTS